MIYQKYSGAGNTFLLFDNREGAFPAHSRQLIRRLCLESPQADGIILLEASSLTDYAMRIFNADGGEAEMCGNGIRCLYRFCHDMGIGKQQLSIQTLGGEQTLWGSGTDVTVGMGAPSNVHWEVTSPEIPENSAYLNTGVPHLVHMVDDVETFPLESFATTMQGLEIFQPHSTNVNIVTVEAPHCIRVRTYERGVGETLACGTGATAAALTAAQKYSWESPISVTVASGDTLKVSYLKTPNGFDEVTLTGPAIRVAAGEIELPVEAISAPLMGTP